jgi:hypothetical protein
MYRINNKELNYIISSSNSSSSSSITTISPLKVEDLRDKTTSGPMCSWQDCSELGLNETVRGCVDGLTGASGGLLSTR